MSQPSLDLSTLEKDLNCGGGCTGKDVWRGLWQMTCCPVWNGWPWEKSPQTSTPDCWLNPAAPSMESLNQPLNSRAQSLEAREPIWPCKAACRSAVLQWCLNPTLPCLAALMEETAGRDPTMAIYAQEVGSAISVHTVTTHNNSEECQ